jgi:hypothetical protein
MNRTATPHTLRNIANIINNINGEYRDIASILTDAGIPTDHDDSELTLLARVRTLAIRRANERRDLAHVRELLDAHNIAGDIPAAVAMLLQERAEWRARTPPAPDVAPGGVEWRGDVLFVNGANVGHIYRRRDGLCDAHSDRASALGLDEATARAVLLALAGQECGRVTFDLRPGAKLADICRLRASSLNWVCDDPPSGDADEPAWTVDPEDVRAWVAEWQAVLTIEAVAGV